MNATDYQAVCAFHGHPIGSDGFCPCGQEYDQNQDQNLSDQDYDPDEGDPDGGG